MSIRLTVHVKIKEGTNADFEAAAAEAMTQVRAEDAGCEQYELFKSVDDPTRYAIIESWLDAEALKAHGKSAGMAKMAGIGPFLAGAPIMHQYEA